jgi:hypothetical protein
MIPWYQSKTLWFNVVSALLAFVPIIGAFVKLIDPGVAVVIDGIIVMVGALGNVILRIFFTTQPISTAARRAALAKMAAPLKLPPTPSV